MTAPTSLAPEALPSVAWDEAGETRTARWQSERGSPPPKNVIATDDRITANDAYGLACQGVGMLWRSDFQNARQLLTALASNLFQAVAALPMALVLDGFSLSSYC